MGKFMFRFPLFHLNRLITVLRHGVAIGALDSLGKTVQQRPRRDA